MDKYNVDKSIGISINLCDFVAINIGQVNSATLFEMSINLGVENCYLE